jgi:hypothetical protein
VEAVSLSQFTATLDDLKGQRFHLDGLLGWLQKAVAALGSVGQVRKWIQPRNHGSHRTPKGKALRIFETCLNMVDMSHLWKKASFFFAVSRGFTISLESPKTVTNFKRFRKSIQRRHPQLLWVYDAINGRSHMKGQYPAARGNRRRPGNAAERGFGIFLDDHDPKREQDIMGISHHH